ncbi:MAG: PspC domain-containing protein [candidate division Zixibacteria bacterium]|nr:PspC domain-containing protein [Candidatus Tariuqbacter arcticus]
MDKPKPKKLYRSNSDRMISGVCGGVAEYFSIDSTIVRILWLLLAFFGGYGILLYIAAMIIIPANPESTVNKSRSAIDNKAVWGILLIVLGLLFFIWHSERHLFHWRFGLGWEIIAPVILIAVGIILIINYGKRERTKAAPDNQRRLYRIREGRMLFGIAGGTGEYFNLDISLARLIWTLLILFTGGLGLLVYLVLYFIIPEKQVEFNTKEAEDEKEG